MLSPFSQHLLKLKFQAEVEMEIYDYELFSMDWFCNFLLESVGKNNPLAPCKSARSPCPDTSQLLTASLAG